MNSDTELFLPRRTELVECTTPATIKRIVLTIGTLGSGGAERVLSILANQWAQRGVDVTLITLNGSLESFYPLHPQVKRLTVHRAESSPGLFRLLRLAISLLGQFRELCRQIRQCRPDLVLSFIDTCNAITLAALFVSRFPRVISERVDPALYSIGWFWQLMRFLLYPTADCLVVQTRGAAQYFRHRAIRRIAIVPNPVLEPTALASDSSVSRPCIVAMGRLCEQKRFGDLIDAFAAIAGRYPNWSLVILGEGPLRLSLEKKARNLGVADRVWMPGAIQGPGRIVSQADIFVLSSAFEGFPNALCEAMALGRAVISTDCRSGPAELIDDSVNGLLVPPKAPQELAKALTRLIEDPAERVRIGQAAAAITTKYNIDSVLSRWDDVFSEAFKTRRRRFI